MMFIEVNRAAVAHVARTLRDGPGGRGVRDLDLVLSRLLDGTVPEVGLRVESAVEPPPPVVPLLDARGRVPARPRPTGRPLRPPLPDPGGDVADGDPVLPAMLRSLVAFPEETREVVVRSLGLGRPPQAISDVAEELGLQKAVVVARLNGALRRARGSFAWARHVEAKALAATGGARRPLADLLSEPWAAGLEVRTLKLLLPRVTGETLRVRGRGEGAVAVRRDRMRTDA